MRIRVIRYDVKTDPSDRDAEPIVDDINLPAVPMRGDFLHDPTREWVVASVEHTDRAPTTIRVVEVLRGSGLNAADKAWNGEWSRAGGPC